MRNEHQQIHDNPATGHSESAQKQSMAKRVGQVGLSIINPFSDLAVIYRTGVKPVVLKLQILREQLKRNPTSAEELNWAQAVERSGRSVVQLQNAFRRKRLAWWAAMFVTGSLAVLLLLMTFANSSLPAVTITRAAITDLVLAAAGLFSFVKVLDANYRLWQLASERVSLEECGTFHDYKVENDMWLQVMMPRASF